MARILLLEPGYQNKYPPLGLMKIAAYHKSIGDEVVFAKGISLKLKPSLFTPRWDRIYITTLFSFEFSNIEKTIDFAIECVQQDTRKIFVGGIAATLMRDQFIAEKKWQGVRFVSGLLDSTPSESLGLMPEEVNGDGDDDGPSIDSYIPDYSILDDVKDDYRYPVHDAYFGYSTRGCPRKCSFCGVPKLEGDLQRAMPIADLIKGIADTHGEKKDLILMDNNFTAGDSFDFKERVAEIRDNGFEAGAKLYRNKRYYKRRVDFNQGVDARILAKDPVFLREISTIAISPLRIAFDHLGLRKVYTRSVEYAAEYGINRLSNYMLYNFHDSPQDLFERLRLNIDLNERLGVRIWSFPMRYQPVDLKDRSHIGKQWNWYWLRSFQIILQATHGVVSGSPDYFRYAFGNTADEFMSILSLPHKMIMHRRYYGELDGKPDLDNYLRLVGGMTDEQRNTYNEGLSKITSSRIEEIDDLTYHTHYDQRIQFAFCAHSPLTRRQDKKISALMKQEKQPDFDTGEDMPAEEVVEDAGLTYAA